VGLFQHQENRLIENTAKLLQTQEIIINQLLEFDIITVGVLLQTAKSLEKLDICHRKHLRSLLNIYWPHGTMSNANLYLRCNSVKLSDRVPKARWKLLGHTLRSADDSPAALAFAVTTNCKGRLSAHRKNLFKIIVNDLTRRGFNLNSLNDLNKLKI